MINLLDQITSPASTIDFPELRQQFYHDELRKLERRGLRIRSATALLYLAFAAFVGSSLMIGLDLFLGVHVRNTPTGLALTGVSALLWAVINLFREARMALLTVKLEFEFLNSLQSERQRPKDASK